MLGNDKLNWTVLRSMVQSGRLLAQPLTQSQLVESEALTVENITLNSYPKRRVKPSLEKPRSLMGEVVCRRKRRQDCRAIFILLHELEFDVHPVLIAPDQDITAQVVNTFKGRFLRIDLKVGGGTEVDGDILELQGFGNVVMAAKNMDYLFTFRQKSEHNLVVL